MDEQPKNPLHGVTLAMMLEQLVERLGWESMGKIVPIRCFTNDPSLKSVDLKTLDFTAGQPTRTLSIAAAKPTVQMVTPGDFTTVTQSSYRPTSGQ